MPQEKVQCQGHCALGTLNQSKTKLYKNLPKFEIVLLIVFVMLVGIGQLGFQGFLCLISPLVGLKEKAQCPPFQCLLSTFMCSYVINVIKTL